MSQYLTLETFRDLSLLPPSYVDTIEAMHPGWISRQLARWSAWIDARLAKRYATPFDAASPPFIVEEWLNRLVTHRCYLKRGVDATDSQVDDIKQDAEKAAAEIKEAAESKEGLFELPPRQDLPDEQGITRGSPMGYAEQSPYTWAELQKDASADEGWGPL
jgi:phage gp36-like protein